jgi:type VI secretion system protein ImpJ
MFLRPQHFQQQVRYLEELVEARAAGLRSFSWGFASLQLDEPALTLGKLAIQRARGVLPDGTPFAIPEDDDPPAPVDVPEELREAPVYLCLPLRRAGTLEVAEGPTPGGLPRVLVAEDEVRDSNAGIESVAPVRVGRLALRLLTEAERREEYAGLGCARVIERRTDGKVLLDESYLPPVLDCQALPRLSGFMRELQGLLHHRAEALADRVAAPGRGGTAEVADFLMLQAINRYEPLVAHFASLAGLHPEVLYRLVVEMAGELATFSTKDRVSPALPVYRHDDLHGTFAPVMAFLRQALSMVLEQNAIPLPLEERRFGVRVSAISDRSLLTQATFVLAVGADMPTEEIRKRLPRQITLGAVERLRDLVNHHLRGVAVHPLPVAPRQLPFRSGYVYFELERTGDYWEQLKGSGGFGLHIAGEFPGLKLEFWAIKG